MKQTWTVYYRMGGRENFTWRKALPVQSYGEASKQIDELRAGGRVAYTAPTNHLDAIGLPETFE
jgi:hypothetical protein